MQFRYPAFQPRLRLQPRAFPRRHHNQPYLRPRQCREAVWVPAAAVGSSKRRSKAVGVNPRSRIQRRRRHRLRYQDRLHHRTRRASQLPLMIRANTTFPFRNV